MAAVPLGPALVAGAILLLPIAATLWIRWIVFHSPQIGKAIWALYRGFGSFIVVSAVYCWWVMWDLRGHSIAPIFPDASSFDETLFFWVPPILSLGSFLVLCYAADRTLLQLRWTTADLLRRAWWRLFNFPIPLLMVAAGFDAIFRRKAGGVGWLLAAGIVATIGRIFSRRAEGMKFTTLKSGEIRNRSLRMATRMGVTLRRVFVVPAGKGHLTNAYGMSNAIGLTDNLGKYLTKGQVDYVIAHELAHVKLKHARKHLVMVVTIFSTLAILSFRFFQLSSRFRPLLQFAVIFGPILAIAYCTRRFEYSADAAATEFTGDPETAIRALVNLHQGYDLPIQRNALSELFMSHPSLARRLQAIASLGNISADRFADILRDEGLSEPHPTEADLRLRSTL